MKTVKLLIIVLLFIFVSSVGNYAFATEYWLLLDSSASLNSRQARLRNESARAYAQVLLQMERENTIGIIDFAENIETLTPTNNIGNINNFIRNIGRSGRLTDIETALNYFIANPSSARREIYLFTDGKVDVAPSRCITCPPTYEDRDSENRITGNIIQRLLAQNPRPVINTIGLGRLVDREFLESISFPTGGGAKQIQNMRDMLNAMCDLFTITRGSPNISLQGSQVTIDGQSTRSVTFIGDSDLRVTPPSEINRDMLDMQYSNYPVLGKRIISITEPPSGIYNVYSAAPHDIRIISNIEINIEDAFPGERESVYQYEVLPYNMALSARNGNPDVMEKLANKYIKINVIIDGSCRGSVELEQTKNDGRKYVFEKEYWLNCMLQNDNPFITNTYFIKDNASLRTDYPDRFEDIEIPVIKTDFDLDLGEKFSPECINFTKKKQSLFVSDKIMPELIFDPPAGINSILSTKYYIGENELPQKEYYTITKDDIGKEAVYAIVKCVSQRDQKIKFKFEKKLSVSFPPFSVTAGSINSCISRLPLLSSLPFTNIKKLTEKIKVPFRCSINKENVLFTTRIESDDFILEQKTITLSNSATEFSLPLKPARKLQPGDYSFKMYLDSMNDLKKPIEYDFSFKIYSAWLLLPVILICAIIVVIAVYATIFLLHLFFTHPIVCSKTSPGGNGQWNFPIRLFPPWRWELEKNKSGDKVCRVSVPFGNKDFKIRFYQKQCENPRLGKGTGCVVDDKLSTIKITAKNFFNFRIFCKDYTVNVKMNRKKTLQ